MEYKGKISGLLFGNTMAITEWIAMQNILTKLDTKALYVTAGIYVVQMILSYYVGHRYDKKQEVKNRIQGLKSREFSGSFLKN
ncbi:hypothetical protein BACCIP111899_00165 [Bacillus rhizoplanae]|uniref:Uncharacterized protein n=1 Tax=Bacillus rhizoplanae TaxID=2880966 RepID=A0ABN7ZTQ7_9BACI|nr:hypothetical protein [Bacillus rhizoplanae]CAG9610993.1 hypothetical protein BACCIP111899_00165 [Bacillus rhizoplanae]